LPKEKYNQYDNITVSMFNGIILGLGATLALFGNLPWMPKITAAIAHG